MTAGPIGGGGRLPRSKHFRPHFWSFVSVAGLAILLNLVFGAGIPAFWPLAVWSVALAVHYFIASALDVNEGWIEDRALDLRTKSYDFDHIRNIDDRIARRDDSIVHHEERDR